MEHLALEVFDLPTTENPNPTASQYAVLEPDATITFTETSEIFADGDVWSYDFTLNVYANAHLFDTAGDIHGSRLHEQINKRKARLWTKGVPLHLGYLKLGDEAEVDAKGNVDVSIESGQKTFKEMIEGTSAQEVSVGDVVIGVALNRKRVSILRGGGVRFTLGGLEAYAAKDERLAGVDKCKFSASINTEVKTPYVQRWPKMVKSHGEVFDGSWNSEIHDYTNVQTPYDTSHPFCNINIGYQLKVNKNGEEIVGRGYTLRLAHDNPTTDGGDHQTRYNNAPNFYLLHFIDRLFKDLGIHVDENQAMDVEDLRRVFMLNYGCFYEELEDADIATPSHETPEDKRERYGQYYLPIIDTTTERYLLKDWNEAGQSIYLEDIPGKVLLREVKVEKDGYDTPLLTIGSIEGNVFDNDWGFDTGDPKWGLRLARTEQEELHNAYSAYLAYATGENYPNVEISEIIEAMKSMFGVRLLFSDNYRRVRIVLLRNVFRSQEVQEISCDIVDDDVKVENSIRGFRMTYGKGTEDTNYYYKGFNDMFPRTSKTWKDTTDKHDYSQWDTNAEYDNVKQCASAMNRRCYVTPVNGNAYVTKVDEEEDVLFPTLVEVAAFIDAEDGDCSKTEDEGKTIEEVKIGASPLIMNEIGNTYASLFTGELKAPSPDDYEYAQKIATFGRFTTESLSFHQRSSQVGEGPYFTISGLIDIYISEGFRIRMEDNYSISNGGTPFDEADPGLQFGIMRSSGGNAHVRYFDDPDDDENGDNDTWEIVPGDGAIDHPDTCDSYGNEWDYDGSYTITPAEAPAKLRELFPNSDAPFYDTGKGYITGTTCLKCRGNDGTPESATVLVATAYSSAGTVLYWNTMRHWMNYSANELLEMSRTGDHFVVEVGSSQERGSTLVQLCKIAYGGSTEPMTIDNGVGSRYGRFSLKLRAEKPNPYFDPQTEEGFGNRRYLEIEKLNLRQRGLADQFYKEYSYWIRNARIVKRTVRMTLAQLQAIDKTKRVRIGDVTGFIRKMQYSVSNETGLGNVVMEIMYI